MTVEQSVIDYGVGVRPTRFDWNYQALDAIFNLAEHYHHHKKLNRWLGELHSSWPNEARHWMYNPTDEAGYERRRSGGHGSKFA